MGHVDNKKISRYLSFILRHKPAEIGIKLDEHGWVDIDELIEKAKYQLTRELLEEIVRTNNKQRFKIDGNKIRASQGHSIGVNLGLKEEDPPDHLYHGTPRRSTSKIWIGGLKKMSRDHVHLSETVTEAIIVGLRRDPRPVVLRISAGSMYKEGFKFYLADNDVWLTDNVPSKFLWLHGQPE